MTHIKAVKADDIQATVLETPGPVVLDFYQATCAPCRVLEPRLDRLAAQYEGRISVYRVDVDADLAVLKSFHVTSVPTLVILKAGKEVGRLDGLITERDLKTAFERALSE